MHVPLVVLNLNKVLAALVLLSSLLLACGRASPAGFWPSYKANLIVKQFSDQGPWGGTRWLHWVAPQPGTFTMADAMSFASSHGWKCAPPVKYTAAQIAVWRYMNKPVFPLHFGPADRPPDNGGATEFPRHIDVESLVSQCDSGWIRVEPGSSKDTTAFGYIQVDAAGSKLAVYHLWGEI